MNFTVEYKCNEVITQNFQQLKGNNCMNISCKGIDNIVCSLQHSLIVSFQFSVAKAIELTTKNWNFQFKFPRYHDTWKTWSSCSSKLISNILTSLSKGLSHCHNKRFKLIKIVTDIPHTFCMHNCQVYTKLFKVKVYKY